MGGGEGNENGNMTATLYYYPLSAPCRSVLILGKMLGIEFDLKSVNPLEKEQLKREFVEVSKPKKERRMNITIGDVKVSVGHDCGATSTV